MKPRSRTLKAWQVMLLATGAFVLVVPLSMLGAWLLLQLLMWLIDDHSHLRMLIATWLIGCVTGLIIARKP